MNKIFRSIIEYDRSRQTAANQTHTSPASGTDYMKVMIRDLHLDMMIGVYEHEKIKPQPVLVNLEAVVRESPEWRSDSLDTAICYATLVEKIRNLAASKHFQLVETLVNEIADELMKDVRILQIMIRAEKTEAIDGVKSVGVELMRARDHALSA